MFLRCAVQDSPKNWKSWLPLAQLCYNSSFHCSLGCPPFKALYGYDPNQRSDREFVVGEHILLRLQPYTQSSVANRPFPKLAYKLFGPYKVIEQIGKVAYKLELPTDSNIHLVFHISQLKPFYPDHTQVYNTLLVTTDLQASEAKPKC